MRNEDGNGMRRKNQKIGWYTFGLPSAEAAGRAMTTPASPRGFHRLLEWSPDFSNGLTGHVLKATELWLNCRQPPISCDFQTRKTAWDQSKLKQSTRFRSTYREYIPLAGCQPESSVHTYVLYILDRTCTSRLRYSQIHPRSRKQEDLISSWRGCRWRQCGTAQPLFTSMVTRTSQLSTDDMEGVVTWDITSLSWLCLILLWDYLIYIYLL